MSCSGYTTEHEMKFIDELGISNGVNWLKLNRKMTRSKMLKNYFSSLKYRHIWGNINKDEIIQHVKNAIKECNND